MVALGGWQNVFWLEVSVSEDWVEVNGQDTGPAPSGTAWESGHRIYETDRLYGICCTSYESYTLSQVVSGESQTSWGDVRCASCYPVPFVSRQ